MFRIIYPLFLLACAGLLQISFLGPKAATSIPPERACTYYISPKGSDTNPGTLRAPWKHLQKAFDTLAAGQVACLRGGMYEPADAYNTPSYRQTMSRSGEPLNPIVIQNYPGETAIVHGLVVVRGNYLKLLGTPPSGGLVFEGPLGPDASGIKGKGVGGQVWLDKCHEVILDHVEIRKNDYHAGLYVSDVSDVQVLGCYVHDNGRFDMDTDALGQHPVNVDQGIYWAASSGTNRIANCVLEHNRADNLQLFAGSGRITGLTVVENTIVKAMNSGIIIGKGADGDVFANNIVSMNNQRTNSGQIRLTDDANNNVIDTNIVWGRKNDSEGVDTSTLSGSGNVVRHFELKDPRFVNFLSGNYRLGTGSPAISAGHPIYVESKDIDGVRRPTRPSLGAYEYNPPQ